MSQAAFKLAENHGDVTSCAGVIWPSKRDMGSVTAAMARIELLDRLRSEGLEGVEYVGPQRHQRIYWVAIVIFAVASAVLVYNFVFTGSDAKRARLSAASASAPPAAVQLPVESSTPAVLAEKASRQASQIFYQLAAEPGPSDHAKVISELSPYVTQTQLNTWAFRIQGMHLSHHIAVGTTDDHYKVAAQDETHVHFAVCLSSHMKTLDSRTNAVIDEDPHDYNAFKADVVKTADGTWKVENVSPAGDPRGTLCTP